MVLKIADDGKETTAR